MGLFTNPGGTGSPCVNCFADFRYNEHTMDEGDFKLEMQNALNKINITNCTTSVGNGCEIENAGGTTATWNSTTSSSISVEANSMFKLTALSPAPDSDLEINLTYSKTGSTLSVTKTQTISDSYLS
ncbi:hypothetical protein C9439_00685 [archaeon SCG-AAA382B04]|nr:hypothetical protein C9439_00685 [archaeon SCG-AAA382B04]